MGFGSFYLFTSIKHRRTENKITLPESHQNQLKSFELEAKVKQIVSIEFCGLSTVRAMHTIPSMTLRKNWLNAEKSNWIFKMEDKLWLVSLIKGMHLLEEDLRRGGRGDNIERERGIKILNSNPGWSLKRPLLVSLIRWVGLVCGEVR